MTDRPTWDPHGQGTPGGWPPPSDPPDQASPRTWPHMPAPSEWAPPGEGPGPWPPPNQGPGPWPPPNQGPGPWPPPPSQGGPAGYGGYGGYGAPWPPPAPKPGVVPLRPISLGEILDGSISTIRRNPKATLGFTAMVMAVSTAITTILAAHLLPGLQRISALSSAGEPVRGSDLRPFAGWLIAYGGASVVLLLAINVILGGVITAVAGRAVLGQQVTAGEAWRQLRGRLGALLWLTVLLLLGTLILPLAVVFGAAVVSGALGIALLIPIVIGMIFLWTRTSLAAPAVVLERASAWRAIVRSWRLTSRSSWRVFGIWLVSYLAAVVAALVLQVPFRLIGDLVSGVSGFGFGTANAMPTGHKLFLYLVISAVGSLVATTVTRPMLLGVAALLYVDLRMRREGLDIVLQSASGPLPGEEFATVWQPPPASMQAPPRPPWQPPPPASW